MKKTNLFDYSILMYFIIRCTFFNLFFNNLLKISKQDSVISIFIGLILSIIPIFIYLKTKHNELNLFDNNKKIYKHYKIINITLIITTLLLSSYLFWNLASFVKQHLLYNTPNLFISLIFLIPIIYTLIKGYDSVNRGKVILFYMSILMFIITYFSLLSNLDLNNIKPINYDSNILLGSLYYITFLILPLYTLNIFPKNTIKNFNTKKIITYAIIFQLIPLLMTLAVLAVYGIDFSLLLNIPEYHVLKRISVFSSLNRVDSILYVQAFFDYFVTLAFYSYFILKGITSTYNIKYPKIIVSILLITVCIIINFINYNTIIFISLHILPYLLIISFLFIPFITMLKSKKH